MYKFNFEDKDIYNKNIFIYGGLYKTASNFYEKYLKIWTKKNLIFSSYKKK